MESDAPAFREFSPGHRSGYVTLVGRPNVGKSTLMNALVGRKLSIVSEKPQTTRHRTLGILTGDAYQVIFLDTPGAIEPRYRLQESMMKALVGALEEADLLLCMVEATDREPDERLLSLAAERPALLLLNKADLVEEASLIPLVAAYDQRRQFLEIVPLSALTGRNVELLRELILAHLPEGPPYYPPEMISEHPERFFVAEIIREKIFQTYRQEIPYSTQVNIVAFEEREGEKDFIDAEIVLESESQKPIVIGKKGEMLKRVGTLARRDIEEFLARPVFLQLHVKVRKDWRRRDAFLRSYGY